MSNKYLFFNKFNGFYVIHSAKHKYGLSLIKFFKISNFTGAKNCLTNNDQISKYFFYEGNHKQKI